jgi:glycerate kinase
MNIAVFSDKFSGTLSAIEVLDIVQSKFLDSSIKADFFSVTDGGQESTEIFKSYNFQMYESFETSSCDNSISVVETIDINGNIFFESAQLIGINSAKDSMSITSGCLLKAIQKTEILGTGGSKTIDFGIGLLSKLGMEFVSNGETIVDPIPQNFSFIDSVKTTDFNSDIALRVLSDTKIPLLDKDSAFDVFGPQKGLSKEDIEKHKLEVERLISLIDKELVLDLNPNAVYSGAAGGLAFTLNQILGCEVESGAKYFIEETNLIKQLENYDIGIFCEGKFDESSLEGKIIGELLKEFKGDRYFLGGQYTAKNNNVFTDYFQCGPEGINNPKGSLEIATNELIKVLQKD